MCVSQRQELCQRLGSDYGGVDGHKRLELDERERG